MFSIILITNYFLNGNHFFSNRLNRYIVDVAKFIMKWKWDPVS